MNDRTSSHGSRKSRTFALGFFCGFSRVLDRVLNGRRKFSSFFLPLPPPPLPLPSLPHPSSLLFYLVFFSSTKNNNNNNNRKSKVSFDIGHSTGDMLAVLSKEIMWE
uniref:Uncharacterized protein n=1 Tax=Cacopsylla melanoneura TaxID=428564 RepID=A0A8D8ZN60_9HEMI